MLGEYISKGQYREVFYFSESRNYVVKRNIRKGRSYNAKEYKSFLYLVEKGWSHWVAPCYLIDDYLVMAYCSRPKKWPKEIPSFLRDAHKNNFGIYQGRFVCIDYPVLNEIKGEVEMVKPRWVDA